VKRRLVVLGMIAIVTTGIASCSNDDAGGDVTTDVGAVPVELTVSAASSLTEAFTEIGRGFEAANDNSHVVFNFGPSDGLASQIQESGGVDVFASASPTWMDAVRDDPGISGRTDFAKNRLALLVPSDNPAQITSLEDLAEPGVKLVLAAEGVPAGDYAREILDNAGIGDAALANVVSNEEDVKGVITKLLSGDADAGIGYVTDVTPEISDQVSLIEIADDVNVIATYPIAVIADSEHPALANAFVDYVLGPGQDVLHEYGFLPAT
jgi:molybdate transport system substrate-binding protein